MDRRMSTDSSSSSSPDSPFMYNLRSLDVDDGKEGDKQSSSVSTPKQFCRRLIKTRLRRNSASNGSTPLTSNPGINGQNILEGAVTKYYCPTAFKRDSPGSPMIVSPTPLGTRSKNIPEGDHNTIMDVVEKSNQQPDLIGDYSKCHALPLIPGKHHDLKSISPQTLARLIQGDFKDVLQDFIVIDCRYPYEYEGGHIKGSVNIYTSDELLQKFFTENQVQGQSSCDSRKTAVIFHCEFSSKRAPKLCRLMRKHDRDQNCYPNLHYPELYLLEGGYKAFYESQEGLCEPQTYQTMDGNAVEMRRYQSIRSKSFQVTDSRRPQSRPLKRTTLGLRNFDC